jgi:hypothetical protein
MIAILSTRDNADHAAHSAETRGPKSMLI